MDAQIKKGILDMCLLHCLSVKPLYGYDIIQSMHSFFPEVNESTFYAILRRLNKDGLTTTFLGEASNGPVRKYYQITETGARQLANMKADWLRLQTIVQEIFSLDF